MGKPPPTDDPKRRYIMSRIKSRDTAIEIALRKVLWHSGIRYRKNYKKLPGAPDIAITKHHIAVFCDGDFWHGKDWAGKKHRIHNNRDYWVKKIERNMERDSETDRRLRGIGWTVLRFWGSEIGKDLDGCLGEIEDTIFQNIIEENADRGEPLSEFPDEPQQIERN